MPTERLNVAVVKLRVERIGYLVPQPSFDGSVQSVYASACNIASDRLLLTLLATGIGDGPTTLALDGERTVDWRTWFRIGDPVSRRDGHLRSCRADLDLSHASIWRPDEPRAIATRSTIEANLREAHARVAANMEKSSSVVHRDGRPVCERLAHACRECDIERALAEVTRLIGWGEGLTPAGDDFLVGLLGGLAAMSPASAQRTQFLARLRTEIDARSDLTTPIATHYLRLAAHGHFCADLHRLRDALLASDDVALQQRLVDDALAVGATSGADRVAGLLAGIAAWLPLNAIDERRP